MIKKNLPIIAIAAFTILLFAFLYERGPTIVKRYEVGPLARSAWDYAGSRGPVLTVIHGNPFTVRDEDFRRTVLETLDRSPTGRVTRYTTDPAQALQPKTRLVLLFDVPEATDGNAVCTGSIPSPAPERDLVMLMVLCSEGRLLAEVGGHMARVGSPDDPLFTDLIGLSLRTLINA